MLLVTFNFFIVRPVHTAPLLHRVIELAEILLAVAVMACPSLNIE